MNEFGIIADIALYYEIMIFIIYNYFLYLVLKRKREKSTDLTNLLLKIFIGFSFALFFSAISKFFNSYWGGVPYEQVSGDWLWLVARLHSGRFGLIGVIVGSMYSYDFYLKVFVKDVDEKKRKIILFLGILVIIYLAVVYRFYTDVGRADQNLELIAFGLLLLYLIIVYIPFMKNAFRLANRIPDEQPQYKKGIKSLGYMASSYIGIFLSFVIDRIMLITIGWAYSIFYFIGWLFVIVAIYTAYSGYIKPAVAK